MRCYALQSKTARQKNIRKFDGFGKIYEHEIKHPTQIVENLHVGRIIYLKKGE